MGSVRKPGADQRAAAVRWLATATSPAPRTPSRIACWLVDGAEVDASTPAPRSTHLPDLNSWSNSRGEFSLSICRRWTSPHCEAARCCIRSVMWFMAAIPSPGCDSQGQVAPPDPVLVDADRAIARSASTRTGVMGWGLWVGGWGLGVMGYGLGVMGYGSGVEGGVHDCYRLTLQLHPCVVA